MPYDLDMAYETAKKKLTLIEQQADKLRHILEKIDGTRDLFSSGVLEELVLKHEQVETSKHKDSENNGFRLPTRRLNKKVSDILLFIGREGRSRDEIINYAEQHHNSKDTATRTMLHTYLKEYGFIEQQGDNVYVYALTERGAKYLENNGYMPSHESGEASDVDASDASINTPNPA